MTHRMLLAAGLTVFAGTAGAVTYDAAGTGYGTAANTPMPANDGLVVIDARSTYERFDTADSDNPMASFSGPCFGSILIEAGQVSGGGHCHYTDADGDIAVMRWTPAAVSAEGMTMGTWTVEGGSGKWDGASGGGDFMAGTGADGSYSNKITGAVTLP